MEVGFGMKWWTVHARFVLELGVYYYFRRIRRPFPSTEAIVTIGYSSSEELKTEP